MAFQDNLKKYREQAGYTSAKDFADVLNVPYPTYMGYENKNREPKYELLCQIADKLGVSTDELLGYKKDEYENSCRIADLTNFIVEKENNLIRIYHTEKDESKVYLCSYENEKDFIFDVNKALESSENAVLKLTDSVWQPALFQVFLKKAAKEISKNNKKD